MTDKAIAPDLLRQAIEDLDPNCLTKLGVSRIELASKAGKLKYYDGRLDQDGKVNIALLFGPGYKIRDAETFNSFTYQKFARILTYESGTVSNRVVLGAQFFHASTSVWLQQTILVRELLHYHFDMDDISLANKYIARREWTGEDASMAITDWLKGGCR